MKAGVEEARKLLMQASDLIPGLRKSIHLGIQPVTQEPTQDQSQSSGELNHVSSPVLSYNTHKHIPRLFYYQGCITNFTMCHYAEEIKC